jgi:hypothetical protein
MPRRGEKWSSAMRLKQSELAAWREKVWEAQGRRCALSQQPIPLSEAVADHCHKSGVLRGVLARGSNSMLGKIENHMRLAKLTNPTDLARVLGRVVTYIAQGKAMETRPDAVLYPTHRTPEEKAERTKKRRAAARKAKKEAA